MNRIDALFERKRREGRRSLIMFLTAGYPDMAATERLIPELEKSGCDLLELGVPFSDPVADGPTIQKASFDALQAGATLEGILQLVERVRAAGVTMPIILFGAYNPFFRFGIDELIPRCAKIGVDGLLAADLPLEESWLFRQRAMEAGLHNIYLTAPTTPDDRKKKIAEKASGFLYYMSVAGITGARDSVAADIAQQIAPFREASDIPVAVGFGVSKPEHVAEVAKVADAAVVGSALINVITEAKDEGPDAVTAAVGEFVKSLSKPLENPLGADSSIQ